MPYEITMKGGKHCVHKQGSSMMIGCHNTHAEAERQRRALYAAEAASVSRASLAAVGTASSASALADATVTVTVGESQLAESTSWEGVLGLEGQPTEDGRYVPPGETSERDLPIPLLVQTQTAEGHDGAAVCGRIESVTRIPAAEFERGDDFDLGELRDAAVVIWGEGVLDGSENAQEAERMIENGAGVSMDGLRSTGKLYDADSLEEIDEEKLDLSEILEGLFSGAYLRALGGKIAGATIVSIPAFEAARVGLTAGGQIRIVRRIGLVASAAPVKPPVEWFADPRLAGLTPLTITPEGRIYGHLADWNGCHTGFERVCVPPFRSASNFGYFNTGEIETDSGELVPCGKLMFCRNGGKHAPVTASVSWQEVVQHYDDATKVGGFVRAGSDRFGTWLAGAMRHDLTDVEIQHLRTHPPSGDWRPIPGKGTELVAAFAVPIPGFPISRALVASGADGLTLISGPLVLPPLSRLERWEKKKTLRDRVALALGR